jgi:hypothetical protein
MGPEPKLLWLPELPYASRPSESKWTDEWPSDHLSSSRTQADGLAVLQNLESGPVSQVIVCDWLPNASHVGV